MEGLQSPYSTTYGLSCCCHFPMLVNNAIILSCVYKAINKHLSVNIKYEFMERTLRSAFVLGILQEMDTLPLAELNIA